MFDGRENGDSSLLFFILVFLLLFYDPRFLELRRSISLNKSGVRDSKILFFITVFLLLFY